MRTALALVVVIAAADGIEVAVGADGDPHQRIQARLGEPTREAGEDIARALQPLFSTCETARTTKDCSALLRAASLARLGYPFTKDALRQAVATAERATGKNVASAIAQWDAKLEPRRLLFRGAMLHERASNASELRAALGVLHEFARLQTSGGAAALAATERRSMSQRRLLLTRVLDGTAAAAEELALCRAADPDSCPWQDVSQLPIRYRRELTARALWDWKTTPPLAWVADVEAAHGAVRRELRAVLAEAGADAGWGLLSDAHLVNASSSGGWSEQLLFDTGEWSSSACARWRATCALARALPMVTGARQRRDGSGGLAPAFVDGQVTILRLLPGTRLSPHHGATNERLLLHMCIQGCEQPGQRLVLNGETVLWREAQAFVWDDSFEHEAIYERVTDDADAPARYVLYMSLWHPDLGEVVPAVS